MNKELNRIIRRFNLTYGFILVALFFISVTFMAINNYQNKIQIAHSISHIVEGKIKSNDLRDVIKILSSAQLDDFRAIGYYNAEGKRLITFPSNINPSYFQNKSLLESIKYFTSNRDLYFDRKQKIKAGTIKFSISPYQSIPLATAIWVICVVILVPIARSYKKLIIKSFEQEALESKVSAIREVQRQVKHDSRGAIQAIKAVIDSSNNLDELELSTLTSATKRLEGMIADSSRTNLEMVQHKIEVQKEALTHLYTAVTDIITEKKLVFGDEVQVNFIHDQKALAIFSQIDEISFKRILSNLLDNAHEAIKEKQVSDGIIEVSLKAEEKVVCLDILDNGIGITEKQLPNVGQKGYTLKSNGTGLGVSWAIEQIKAWKGRLKVESQHGAWTKIRITLPVNNNALWTTDSISLKNINSVVAIDDDPSVVQIWKSKFSDGAQTHIDFSSFESGTSFLEESSFHERTLYLIDYDLGTHGLNGINVATNIRHKEHIYIATNNFDDWEVQRFCADFGAKLIPKTIISKLEIQRA